MHQSLGDFAPGGRENCLCGSGDRYKNCCKYEWPKHNYTAREAPGGTPSQRLKRIRAHITWYRLCHLAHTTTMCEGDDKGRLLSLDIKTLYSLVKDAYFFLKECGYVESYLFMVQELSQAILDKRWSWLMTSEEALYHLVVMDDRQAARAVLSKCRWQNVTVSELLEVYLDVYHEELGFVDIVGLASRIAEVSEDSAVRFQYKFLVAVQYFLMNEPKRAEALARASIAEYEGLPIDKRSRYGRVLLGRSFKHLGQLLTDELMLQKAIGLITVEAESEGYTSGAIADFWSEIGECHQSLGQYYLAEKFLCRSLGVIERPLAKIYLAEVQLSLGRIDRAMELLDQVGALNLSSANRFDYSIARCRLAMESKGVEDVSIALSLIKEVKTNDPYFKDLIQGLIIALYELPRSSSAQGVWAIISKINRYVSLKPNVAGVGVDFNAIIEDYINKKV